MARYSSWVESSCGMGMRWLCVDTPNVRAFHGLNLENAGASYCRPCNRSTLLRRLLTLRC